jgi:nitroreductase
MNTVEAILTRRSIRKYADQPVSSEMVKELLRSAMSAPSAGNEQPWQFVVIDDRSILDQIPTINPYAGMAKDAPLAVLVCGDLHLEQFAGYWVQDCSAAIQNLLLAAHDKGLGAVWTGIYPMEDRTMSFRKMFNLPDHVIPLALVVIGYPAQQIPPEDRYREDRVHYNSW